LLLLKRSLTVNINLLEYRQFATNEMVIVLSASPKPTIYSPSMIQAQTAVKTLQVNAQYLKNPREYHLLKRLPSTVPLIFIKGYIRHCHSRLG
jgi:hypothetical protein